MRCRWPPLNSCGYFATADGSTPTSSNSRRARPSGRSAGQPVHAKCFADLLSLSDSTPGGTQGPRRGILLTRRRGLIRTIGYISGRSDAVAGHHPEQRQTAVEERSRADAGHGSDALEHLTHEGLHRRTARVGVDRRERPRYAHAHEVAAREAEVGAEHVDEPHDEQARRDEQLDHERELGDEEEALPAPPARAPGGGALLDNGADVGARSVPRRHHTEDQTRKE